jgi:cobalt-zinc-cadmium efflux system membrane fusion protein
MKRGRHPVVFALLVLALATLSATLGCSRSGGDAAQTSAGETSDTKESAAAADSGVVELDSTAVARAGIRVAPAGPATIDVTVGVPGEVRLDPRAVLEVKPRFAGVLREIRKELGQAVRRGDVLARVESNESLTRYDVTSSIAGRVIARNAALGQTVTQETVLCTVADLSNVWIEFGIYPNQVGRVRVGQHATVSTESQTGSPVSAQISYVSPTVDPETRVAVGRIVLPNPNGRWEPGMFVQVSIAVDHADVPVAVPDAAVVRTAEGPVVFVADGTKFRETRIRVGRSDGTRTEILDGIAAGTSVVATNAFVVRSELEKSEYAE